MFIECENCVIYGDRVCSECKRYQECIERGMNFETLENEPEEGYPDCFRCAYLVGDECIAE